VCKTMPPLHTPLSYRVKCKTLYASYFSLNIIMRIIIIISIKFTSVIIRHVNSKIKHLVAEATTRLLFYGTVGTSLAWMKRNVISLFLKN